MKICFISLYPPDREGEAYYSEQLIKELCRFHLFQFTILAHVPKGLEPSTISNDDLDISIKRIWDVSNPVRSIVSIINLLRAIIAIKPDIVHFQYNFTRQFGISIGEPFLIVIFFTRVIFRVKTIVSLHNFWLSSEVEQRAKEVTRSALLAKLFKYYYFIYCKLFLNIPNKVVNLVNEKNSPITRLIVMSCKPEKVVEILHGMPCVNAPKNYYRTRKIARKKFDLDGRFVVLLFGIIFRKKGYENVILAARALLDLDETLMDKLIFLIVGAAIDEDSRKYFLYIENLSKKLKVDHIVKFVPKYVSDDEVCDYFTASEVLILPYTYYGGPSGVLELAFAYGTPVIAVRNNIAVSNGGFTQKKDDLPILYIENSNYKTIASTVLATFKNRKILRNLRRDIKLIREARSMDMIAKEHVKLYQSLFGNDGST